MMDLDKYFVKSELIPAKPITATSPVMINRRTPFASADWFCM